MQKFIRILPNSLPSLSNAASPHCSQNPGKDWVWSQHVPRRISSYEDVVTAQSRPHTDPLLATCPIPHSDPDPHPLESDAGKAGGREQTMSLDLDVLSKHFLST